MATIEIEEECIKCSQNYDCVSCHQKWDGPLMSPGHYCPGPGEYRLIRVDRLTPEAVREWCVDEANVEVILAFLDHARGM